MSGAICEKCIFYDNLIGTKYITIVIFNIFGQDLDIITIICN
jgi:hypothetical protein